MRETIKIRRKRQKRILTTTIILAFVTFIIAGCSMLKTLEGPNGEKFSKKEYKEFMIAQDQRDELMAEARKLSDGYFYDEAIDLLQSRPELVYEYTDKSTGNTFNEIAEMIDYIESQKSNLVKYEGNFFHVFFHSLIVYPELAFDNVGHNPQGYNMWMTTVKEFQRMLPEFKERGYILYNLDDVIEPNPDVPGQTRVKDIYLPAGKIPMVISVDDVNYYEYMQIDGFASRLALDEDGKVGTYVIDPTTGKGSITRDGDVVPILDDFIENNPDFSFRGAKGTLALTGYQGALGYRVNDDNLSEAEKSENAKEAKKVADALKKTGWKFACHSFSHNQYFAKLTVTMGQIGWDTSEWKKWIEPVVGETNLYISPFGVSFKNQDPRYRYLVEQGFNVYCSVGNSNTLYDQGDNVYMSRNNLDGYAMYKRPDYLKKYFFDPAKVLDEARPPCDF